MRESTTDTPKCNVPPEGNEVFGKVYPGQVHGMDMSKSSTEAESEELTPADIGFEMFSKALEQWLEFFGDVSGAQQNATGNVPRAQLDTTAQQSTAPAPSFGFSTY
jgi:hypothetical protein